MPLLLYRHACTPTSRIGWIGAWQTVSCRRIDVSRSRFKSTGLGCLRFLLMRCGFPCPDLTLSGACVVVERSEGRSMMTGWRLWSRIKVSLLLLLPTFQLGHLSSLPLPLPLPRTSLVFSSAYDPPYQASQCVSPTLILQSVLVCFARSTGGLPLQLKAEAWADEPPRTSPTPASSNHSHHISSLGSPA